jgi:hypothetical protein
MSQGLRRFRPLPLAAHPISNANENRSRVKNASENHAPAEDRRKQPIDLDGTQQGMLTFGRKESNNSGAPAA